jgi:hypothetical protein
MLGRLRYSAYLAIFWDHLGCKEFASSCSIRGMMIRFASDNGHSRNREDGRGAVEVTWQIQAAGEAEISGQWRPQLHSQTRDSPGPAAKWQAVGRRRIAIVICSSVDRIGFIVRPLFGPDFNSAPRLQLAAAADKLSRQDQTVTLMADLSFTFVALLGYLHVRIR